MWKRIWWKMMWWEKKARRAPYVVVVLSVLAVALVACTTVKITGLKETEDTKDIPSFSSRIGAETENISMESCPTGDDTDNSMPARIPPGAKVHYPGGPPVIPVPIPTPIIQKVECSGNRLDGPPGKEEYEEDGGYEYDYDYGEDCEYEAIESASFSHYGTNSSHSLYSLANSAPDRAAPPYHAPPRMDTGGILFWKIDKTIKEYQAKYRRQAEIDKRVIVPLNS